MLYGLWRAGLAGASESDAYLSEGPVAVGASKGRVEAGGGSGAGIFATARGGIGGTGPASLSIDSDEAAELAAVDDRSFTLETGFTGAGFAATTPSDEGAGALAKSEPGGGVG